jgi:hypothetical protein
MRKSMASTQDHDDHSIVQEWFFAHLDAKRRHAVDDTSPEVRRFRDHLWPAALDYHSPLNPVFLAGCTDLGSLFDHPSWFVRDGLIPLLWFFKTHPNPGGFQGRLWVAEEFAKWVPLAWRSVTGSYRIECPVTTAPSRARCLLLTGLSMESFCSLEFLEQSLAELSRMIPPKELKKREILAFTPARTDNFGSQHHHNYTGEYIQSICKALGTQIRFLNWQSLLETLDSGKTCDLYELNEKLLCADSYFVHAALSRGARLLRAKSPRSTAGTSFIELSPHHGVRLKKRIQEPSLWNSKDSSRFFANVMLKEANQAFPWPNWFMDWGMAAAERSTQ